MLSPNLLLIYLNYKRNQLHIELAW